MSRIRIVGGSITKTSKGATTLEALDGNLVMIAAKQIILDGGENGITHHEYVPPKKKEEDKTAEPKILDAKCIVQFRPTSSWGGQFGFDWFRTGNTGLEGDVSYETLVGQHYDKVLTDPTKIINTNREKWTEYFKADPQPAEFSAFNKIEQLKELYGVYEYSLENNSSGSPINKKYYKPVLALFAREADPLNPKKFIETGKAELDLYIEYAHQDKKEKKPNKLIFEMDGVLMDENHPHVSINKHTILEKKLSNKIDIEITCKAEFAEDKEIKVWAISQDKAGNQTAKLQAGVLKMIAPAKKTIKDVVVVLVKTAHGTGSAKSLDILTKMNKQALIKTNITQSINKDGNEKVVIIDVSIPENNVHNIDFDLICEVDRRNEHRNIKKKRVTQLDYLLNETLRRDYPQFNNHFKLFFIKNAKDLAISSSLSSSFTRGYATPQTDYGVMFWGHDKYTIGHEALHAFGLPHSWFNDSFVYQGLKTDNIMDYSYDIVDNEGKVITKAITRISTWYWQWKIMNNL